MIMLANSVAMSISMLARAVVLHRSSSLLRGAPVCLARFHLVEHGQGRVLLDFWTKNTNSTQNGKLTYCGGIRSDDGGNWKKKKSRFRIHSNHLHLPAENLRPVEFFKKDLFSWVTRKTTTNYFKFTTHILSSRKSIGSSVCTVDCVSSQFKT